MSKPIIELRLLGNPQILINNELVQGLTSIKSQALLYYLATKQSNLSRVALGGLLWADKSDDEARVNLRQALRQIVKALPDAVLSSRETLMINSSLVASDVQRFEALSTASDIALLEEAAALYRGDFLEGFFVENALEFEDWQLLEQERLRLIILNSLEALRRYFVEQHALEDALKYTSRFLSIEPFHEESQRAAMRLLSLQGSYRLALQQYTTYHSQLQRELGVQPSLETITLYQRIKRLSLVSLPELPSEFSPLVGRETELKEVTELLTTNNRLVTLLGSGGVGKTRFALAVAKQLQEHFLEGVFWVELVGLTNASFVASSIASSLGIQLSGNQSANEQLIAFLADKELLLVLDNFEHLLSTDEAVNLVQRIWQDAPSVTLLVSSRVRLNLRAELSYVIDQLAFPTMESVVPEAVPSFESVRLFEQVSSRAGKTINELQERITVGHICELVEGMPLAIEMVAALAPEVPLLSIQSSISENLTTLSTSMRDVPQRQRSLQATFNYSLVLLSESEQVLLFKLSVFRGGFSLEAAQEITDAKLVSLSKLVSHSLIRQDRSGRYSMHEVIRQLAQDNLSNQIDLETVTEEKHRLFYTKSMAGLAPKLTGDKSQVAMSWLSLELSNIHVAWQSAIDTRDLSSLKDARKSLVLYYQRVRPAAMGEALMASAQNAVQSILKHQKTQTEEVQLLLAEVLVNRASFQKLMQNYGSSEALLNQSIDLAKSLGQETLCARSYNELGYLHNNQGQYDKGKARFEKALKLLPVSERVERVRCLDGLGTNANWLGHTTEAEKYFDEALAIAKSINSSAVAGLYIGIGNLRSNQGHIEDSIRYYGKAIEIREQLQNTTGVIAGLINIGISYDLIGEYAKSQKSYEKALSLCRISGDKLKLNASLINLARVEHFLGNYEPAFVNYQTALADAVELNHISVIQANLALLALNTSDYKTALAYSDESIARAIDSGSGFYSVFGYLFKAHAQCALGQSEDAFKTYQKVIDICQEINTPAQEMEALAGQACVLLDQQDLKQAMVKIEPVLSFIKENPEVDGTEEPLRLYLIGYKVLEACGDPRAKAVLEAGYKVLMGRAKKLEDEALKESYLNNVLVHKELISAYEQSVIETS